MTNGLKREQQQQQQQQNIEYGVPLKTLNIQPAFY